MSEREYLLRQAERSRRLAKQMPDDLAREALLNLAAEYEAQAAQVDTDKPRHR